MSEKTNKLLNVINKQPELDKFLLHAKDFYKSKNQKAWWDWFSSNTKGCNPGKKRKVLMVFHDMIADTIRNKKTSSNIHWII